MDLKENYVITSTNGTPSSFVSDFTYPIRLEEGHKIAVKSIHYGPKFNVTDDNNLLWLYFGDEMKMEHRIDKGWYHSVHQLFNAIAKESDELIDIWNKANEVDYDNTTFKYDGTTISLTYDENVKIMKDPTRTWNNILNIIDIEDGYFNELVAPNNYFSEVYPAFLYASVIENSFIDNFASRHLSLLSLRSGYKDGTDGYHYHEFTNPTFYKFNVSEFSHIKFEIRDVDGNLVDFDPRYKTFLTLEVFKPLDITP